MKSFLSLIGRVLLVLAFVASTADFAAHLISTEVGSLPPAGQVWGIFAPQHYEAFVRSHPGSLWQTLLQIPAWALLGIPGLVLLIGCRKSKSQEDIDMEDSMFLFDELAKHAKEQNYDDLGDFKQDDSVDDQAPSDHEDMSVADDRYTKDNIVDDVLPDRDYLLGKKR